MNLGKPRILLLQTEYARWRCARHWSYTVQLGIEEGLRGIGVDVKSILSPWISRASTLYASRTFDQVWVDLVHPTLDEPLLDWLADTFPVRIGLIGESLNYTTSELTISRLLAPRRNLVERRLPYFTHVLAVDEVDAAYISSDLKVPTMWWPQAIPRHYIEVGASKLVSGPGIFIGEVYGERGAWLRDRHVRGLLQRQSSSERGTVYPWAFNCVQFGTRCCLMLGNSGERHLNSYVSSVRWMRRRCFRRWLRSLQAGIAVVNLPSAVKAYAGRVVEGMAAGRPVVSWRIPDRPRTASLFAENEDILLFSRDCPEELAAHLARLKGDLAFANRVVNRARTKVERFHTMERRVSDIINWIESGIEPAYCD